MVSLRRRQGYFVADNRVAGGNDDLLECPTETCAHCNCVKRILPDSWRARHGLPARSHPRGYCAKCDAYVCDNETCQKYCTPVLKLIDVALRTGLPTLVRGPRGEFLFDPEFLWR